MEQVRSTIIMTFGKAIICIVSLKLLLWIDGFRPYPLDQWVFLFGSLFVFMIVGLVIRDAYKLRLMRHQLRNDRQR